MFLIHKNGQTFDFDLEFLRDLIALLDARLDELAAAAKRCPDPDSWGYYDSAEHITEIGFIACQKYLAATYGPEHVPKPDALRSGPVHRCGAPLASLLNHPANYAKHHEEWFSAPPRGPSQRTRDGLDVLDLSDSQCWYLLTSVLAELVAPATPRFRSLIPLLEAWRDSLPGA